MDGYVFGYYSKMAEDAYEHYLHLHNLSDSVIGYRRGLGSNADMAAEVFSDIGRRRKSTVICLDISSFFDSIDHRALKANLLTVLGLNYLLPDWFAVFKAMTRYSWVDAEELALRLGFSRDAPPRPLCTAAEFRQKVRGGDGVNRDIIRRNFAPYGIPQGSPISAVLSNIFMIEFDHAVRTRVVKRGGLYRRYSDDIIIVCQPSSAKAMLSFVLKEIKKLGSAIEISEEKTEICNFRREGSRLFCDAAVTYLGFTFDGRRVLLRARTLSRYYRRMTYAARGAVRAGGQPDKTYRRKLFREFTHLGKRNFYSYAKKAAAIFDCAGPTDQLRRHFRILHRKLYDEGR